MERQEVYEHLKHLRQNILDGGINCIPIPFERFREEFPGIQKFFYVVTGATKASKTQITNFLFVITPIFYWLEHPDQIKPTIFYFPLEEDEMSITLRFYSYVLWKVSGGKIIISPTDLESTDERYPLAEKVLEMIGSDERFRKYADAFEQCVHFYVDVKNPTGIYKTVKDYMKAHGAVTTEPLVIEEVDDFTGQRKTRTVEKFKRYVPDDPNEIVISITDHLGLLSLEKGCDTIKDAIEQHSLYNIELRNNFGVCCVDVQQQNSQTTNLDAFKANKIRPTKDGLKDSKRPGEDCTVLIGMTNPKSFDLPEYLGYDLRILGDHLKVLEVVLNRKGKANGLCPLYFDGRICQFKELPLPTDREAMAKVYDYMNRTSGRISLLSWKKVIKKIVKFSSFGYLRKAFQ